MKFFQAKFSEYQYIKKLIHSNGRSLPRYKKWKNLWLKNPTNKRLSPGEIVKFEKNSNKIYAYHSSFSKTLKIKNTQYQIEISSNWNVHKKFRSISIQLLNRFLNKNTDFFLTSTGNLEVAKIWKAFGAYEVNSKLCSIVFYKVFNTSNFLRSVLIKKNIPKIVGDILYLFLSPLFFLDYWRNNNVNKLVRFVKLKKIDQNISNFIKKYQKTCKDPIEIRSGNRLQWYLDIISSNKDIHILKIYFNNYFAGYAILAIEFNKNLMLRRAFLAEIRIRKSCNVHINEILMNINVYCKNLGSDILEIKNLDYTIDYEITLKFTLCWHAVTCSVHAELFSIQ